MRLPSSSFRRSAKALIVTSSLMSMSKYSLPRQLSFSNATCDTTRKIHSHSSSFVPMSTSVASIKGGREYMEDEYFVSEDDDTIAFGVFDGHGGAGVSKYLKVHFPSRLQDCFHGSSAKPDCISSDSDSDSKSNSMSMDTSLALTHALASIDEEILTGPYKRHLHHQGATACVLHLTKASGTSLST